MDILELLSNINDYMNDETIKNASTEQLAEYLKLTNELTAKIAGAIKSNEE